MLCGAASVGVPLLLGSVYGADFLQAALTATLALPQPATVVLADQQQQLTMARFRLLADGLSQLQQLLVSAVAGVAHAEVSQPTVTCSISNTPQPIKLLPVTRQYCWLQATLQGRSFKLLLLQLT